VCNAIEITARALQPGSQNGYSDALSCRKFTPNGLGEFRVNGAKHRPRDRQRRPDC
jgi:hypothetical protein